MASRRKTEHRMITSPEVKVRQKAQITLPREVQQALHIREGDHIRFNIKENGEVLLEGLAVIPADQRWFWTPEWQAGEREASEDIKAGRVKRYHDIDEMFDDMDREKPA